MIKEKCIQSSKPEDTHNKYIRREGFLHVEVVGCIVIIMIE